MNRFEMELEYFRERCNDNVMQLSPVRPKSCREHVTCKRPGSLTRSCRRRERVDGGVVNNVPIAQAVAGGATELYILLSADVRSQPAATMPPLESVFELLSIAVHTRFSFELAELRETSADVKVVVFVANGNSRMPRNHFSATGRLISKPRRSATATIDGLGISTPRSDD